VQTGKKAGRCLESRSEGLQKVEQGPDRINAVSYLHSQYFDEFLPSAFYETLAVTVLVNLSTLGSLLALDQTHLGQKLILCVIHFNHFN
jgi:hypothetical protein